MIYRFIKKHEDRIGRIVFDEFHQLVVSSDFRPDLQNIADLLKTTPPKIFLTGTLPPSMVESTYKLLGFSPHSTFYKEIRTTTNRPDLSYHCVQIPHSKSLNIATITLTAYLHGIYFKKKSRGMIFCPRIRDADKISEELHTTKCHGDVEDKAAELEMWRQGWSGPKQWMTATSCLTHGIDPSNVEIIIFAGRCSYFNTIF